MVNEDGILSFPDTAYVIKVLASLDLEIKTANNLFREQYGNLSEVEYNQMFDSLGLNEQQPLINFENELGFESMRVGISAAHDAWLESDGENDELNPNRHFIVDNTVRTILNKYGEVKIGNVYYLLEEDGYSGFLTRSALNKFQSEIKFSENKVSDDGCNSSKRNDGTIEVSSSKKYEWVVSHYTYIWGRYVVAKMDNYEKKKRKGWKKYKTQCTAQVYGDCSGWEGDCTTKATFNTASGSSASANDNEVKHKIAVTTKTKSGWVIGFFSAAGKNNTNPLTW